MKTLSVIMPVYNEKQIIGTVAAEWARMLKKAKISYTFIFCEDASTDGTLFELQKISKKFPTMINHKQYRRGYGQAVIDGITHAKSTYIVCVDSDGQCDPVDFLQFWNVRNHHDVIIGNRTERADPMQRKIFSSLFKKYFLLLFPTHIQDPSAPFVLFKKQTIMPHVRYLQYMREGFWWGFVAMCVKKGLSLHQFTINHRARKNSKSQIYTSDKMISIAIRNGIGLLRLNLAR